MTLLETFSSFSNVIHDLWVPIIGPAAAGLSGYFISRRQSAVAEAKVIEESRATEMERIHDGFATLIDDLKRERDDYRAEVVELRKHLDLRSRENCDICPTRANLERQLGVARKPTE